MAELRRKITVRMHDTDSAGILFFANQFLYMHDVYEDFLREIEYPMERLIVSESFFVPIVHAESQFTKQLSLGDVLTLILKVERVGKTSYTLRYELLTATDDVAGTGKTVHVSIDRETREKIELPRDFRIQLERFQSRERA